MKTKLSWLLRQSPAQGQVFGYLLPFLFWLILSWPLLIWPGIPNAYSHAYMDFAVGDVWLDEQCHLNVAINNVGGTLPDHFYFSQRPAWLNVTKGQQQETSAAFSQLDGQRVLTNNRKSLVITSKSTFANNAKPVTVSVEYGTEFGDFNQRNDSVTRAMDCQIGLGQIAGEAIVYGAPDVAIEHASIDAQSCALKLELSNKTGIALNSTAWAPNNGVTVVIKNSATGARKYAIPLRTLDPKKQFTRSTQTLSWISNVAITQMQHASVAVWYVTGDNDFSNNEKTITVPLSCTIEP